MAKIDKTDVTGRNLDRLSHFLSSEIEQPALAGQIPDGAHIFHGSYKDIELTQANAETASAILIEMALGIQEEAPLVMLLEYKPGKRAVIDLSTEERKRKARAIIKEFQEQSQREMFVEINELLAA